MLIILILIFIILILFNLSILSILLIIPFFTSKLILIISRGILIYIIYALLTIIPIRVIPTNLNNRLILIRYI